MRSRGQKFPTDKSFKTVKGDKTKKDWHPGQEPGLDPSKPNGGRKIGAPLLHERCQITVMDYSGSDLEVHDFDNQGLIDFLKAPQEEWIKCRWINVNGLSWDVIQAVAENKNLHRLAIEDLVNTESRTKADWYTDHTFIVMTLFKLIHLHDSSQDECDTDTEDSEDNDNINKAHGLSQQASSGWKWIFGGKSDAKQQLAEKVAVSVSVNGGVTGHTKDVEDATVKKVRTLQRFHSGRNEDKMTYMERHSVLAPQKEAVSAEQVSIFLTADNTVISFFENSADDLEGPILHRLCTPDTILRSSCDGSLLLQALIDAIIDLAIPVTRAYEDFIGTLELNVLTDPNIKHTKNLYIATTEITKMRANISPTIQMINALRDHKISVEKDGDNSKHHHGNKRSAHCTVDISSVARVYFGDVEDHILQMIDSMETMHRSCDNMIDLIFNTVSAYQNESMKQLTVVTIIFLPLSFLSGYFGMNFVRMDAVQLHSDLFFWEIALPVAFAVTLWLMKDTIKWYVIKVVERRGIARARKGRLLRAGDAKKL
ncbi:cora family metal ion transporter-like protein [Calycina marina]|uniref:Cora family metal ion transporter-like protein n=1 Tax=Calycina marina TaxID=1763456 RepID=A0A9P8CE40_9HELO|nr:cora family metal ion transporter-like protein [Calycina marina]